MQPSASLEDHRGIAEEIRAGNAAAAADRMPAHLVSTADSLIVEGQVKESGYSR